MANERFLRILAFLCGCSLVLAIPSAAQAPGAGGPATASGGSTSTQSPASSPAPFTPPPQQGDPNYSGSVPQGTATATPIPLGLGDAIARGLKANLGLLTSQESNRETAAQRLRALSGLLPKVNGQISETEQQINLQAEGFNITLPPSSPIQIPRIIGPYSYGSAQANFSIPFFDYSAISNYRSSKQSTKAAALSVKNARDLVVQAVGNAYLLIIADQARVVATQAEIDADNAVFTNATRRHDAGTGTGLDVMRAQVELKQRQQTLLAQTNQTAKDKLTLGRIIGLPLGQDFTITDPSQSVPLETVSLPDALKKAYGNRPDFQAAAAQVRAAEFAYRAAKAERYPTLTASGFYGDQGLDLFTNSHGVFSVAGSIQFNIFDGGRIKGDIQQNDADLRDKRNQLENLRGQVDYEVRNALLDLKSAADQVSVAQSNVGLANETLNQSRDRFAAGVTNSVEVVQSQQTVAEAYENLISAQYQYNVGKVSLARALGLAEESIRGYFNQP
ncbi:MAG TPA: TolC family protein [Bryobacteraceae bacterium]|jgi:outer membrane protein TolC|nr:TolC family protein [Bryobacteraceae bacterium]